MLDKRKYNGGARTGSGPKPKVHTPGDEPKNTTVKVEPTIIKICREKHGSLSNALRFAAK